MVGSAQRVMYGVEAAKVIPSAAVVRTSQFSSLPSFVKFRASEQVSIARLNAWMSSSFRFEDGSGFRFIRKESDILGHEHFRFQQMKDGYAIEDAIWIAHTNNDLVYSMNGLIYKSIPASSGIALSESAALDKAKEYVGAEVYKWELPGEEQHLQWETNDPSATYFPKGELVWVSQNGTFKAEDHRLAYKFNVYAHAPVSRSEIYVDASTGEILRENQIINFVDTPGTGVTAYSGERDIIADSFDGEFRLRDGSRGNGVRTFDMNEGTNYAAAVDFTDADNYWDNVNPERDEYAADAHWATEMTYDYFFLVHGRNSINGAGFTLNSYIHYDENYVNAFWDGSRMTYGDGSGGITPLVPVDIVAHEVTHGLTSFSADLIYMDESGALNESFSDIFGNSVERYARPDDYNWLVGDEIGITIRSMSNPNSTGNPDTYLGDFWEPIGGGWGVGVHNNSTVQSYWY